MEALLTVAEVAKLLQVSRSQVYGLAERGELPSFKLGALRRFAVEDVRRWVEERREPASA